jgi:hypothetical protein
VQRWLVSQAKHPKSLVAAAVVMIAYGIWGLASQHFAEHPVTMVTTILLGIYLMAVAITGLRERRSVSGE